MAIDQGAAYLDEPGFFAKLFRVGKPMWRVQYPIKYPPGCLNPRPNEWPLTPEELKAYKENGAEGVMRVFCGPTLP